MGSMLRGLCSAVGVFGCAAGVLGAGDVVISQVWGGPSSSTGNANYPRADYIELFNRTNSAVTMSGWSLNIATSTGSSWTKLDLFQTIPARSYFLVRVSPDANNGLNIPAPDADFGSSSFTLLSTTGKVALRSTTDPIGSTTCPTSSVVDLVTYTSSSNSCVEGSGPAPAGSTSGSGLATFRRGDGCTDTDDNSRDFVTRIPAPRNSATAALAACDIGACCDNALTGLCFQDSASGCTASGFTFTSVGTACSPHPCTPTGACCTGTSFTTCNVRTEAACTGRWTAGAGCSPDNACSSSTSCCLPDGSCCTMVAVLCTDAGGTPGPYEVTCTAAGNCSPAPSNDLCAGAIDLTLGMPVTGNGWLATFNGDGPQAPCLNSVTASTKGIWFKFTPTMSGLYEVDTCGTQFNSDLVVFSVPNCANPATWTVVGCDDQTCPSPALPAFCGNSTGATVSARLQGVPLQSGQTYHIRVSLNGTLNTSGNYRIVVNEVFVAATGACCFATNGRCEIRSMAGCTQAEAPFGTYQGDNTTCTPGLCGSGYGACCGTSGACQLRLESACTGASVFWLDGVACFPNPCEINPVPPNGTCATARVVTDAELPFNDIVGINQAPDGPAISCSTAQVTRNAVWYRYTAPAGGIVSAWELGSRTVSVVVFDAGMGPPACDNWTEVLCETTETDANFPVEAGHTYYLLFTTPGSASTNVNDFYNVQIRRVVPGVIPNDTCQTAIALSSTGDFLTFPAGGATPGPRSQCQTLSSQPNEARNAIWFTYTSDPNNDQLVATKREIDNANNIFFSLQFFTGGCNNLVPLECVSLGSVDNFVRLPRNTTFHIMAHKRSGYMAGDGVYKFTFNVTTPAQTPNPTCETATVVPNLPFNDSVHNFFAYDEPSVSNCGGQFNNASMGSGVWYRYTPSELTIVTVNELGSQDAAIRVFENSCSNAILCTLFESDTTGWNNFRALPGTTYYILVAREPSGLPSTSDTFEVSIFGSPVTPPGNDNCATATPILSLPFADTVGIAGAADDVPKAVCSRGTAAPSTRHGVWYSYHNGPALAAAVMAESSPLDAIIAAYKGVCGGLEAVMCTDSPESSNYLYMQPNTTYYILVAKAFDQTASPGDVISFSMDLASPVVPPPSNQFCTAAQPLTRFPFVYTGSPLASTNGPVTTCAFNAATTVQSTNPLWYAINGGPSGLTLHLYETSSNNVTYALYQSCGGLDDACSTSDGSATTRTALNLGAGGVYYLQVALEGNNDLTLGAAPFNLTVTVAPGTAGACCNNSACTVSVIEDCTTGFVPGATCDPGNPTACCPANFNGAGGVTVADIFAFLTAWFAANPAADFNQDGAVTVSDIFAFLTAWFAGCS